MSVPYVFVCIPTRDGTVDHDVRIRAEKACHYAAVRNACKAILVFKQGPYGVAPCRNMAVSEFFKGPYTHIWFIDDDVRVQEDSLYELLKMDGDVNAGCYPSVKGIGKRSVPYITVQESKGKWHYKWFYGVRDVWAAGTGCMLIARHVLEKLDFPWFVWRERYAGHGHDIDRSSDDIDFCERVQALGLNIKANGAIRCGHYKKLDVANFIVDDGEEAWPVTWSGPTTVDGQNRWPDYGSHVPALVSVAKTFKIKTVTEFGSGRYSTSSFLNREYFPDLEKLKTIESNQQWFLDTMKRNKDSRLELSYCPIARMFEFPIPESDLILIDCDCDEDDGQKDFTFRGDLIKRFEDSSAIVVVHDSNFESISKFVLDSKYRYRNTYVPQHGPQTTVMSNLYDVTKINWLEVQRTR